MAILCTKEQAHVSDLLMKHQSGELNCNIPLVISNHNELKNSVEQYGIEYHHLPVDANNRESQEKEILSLLGSHNIDVVVLARYMQILSPKIVKEYEGRVINIHHAFLPAFKGNRPYHKAWVRGVKMIGATAHYVTEDLDEGPIIEQDVESVTHQHSVKEMIQAGRDIERRVLTSAVKAHLQHRILLHGQRTLIFHS
jgi:formyltetrahydrofolate deformylase